MGKSNNFSKNCYKGYGSLNIVWGMVVKAQQQLGCLGGLVN